MTRNDDTQGERQMRDAAPNIDDAARPRRRDRDRRGGGSPLGRLALGVVRGLLRGLLR